MSDNNTEGWIRAIQSAAKDDREKAGRRSSLAGETGSASFTESIAALDAFLFIKLPMALAMLNAEIGIMRAHHDMQCAKRDMEMARAEYKRLLEQNTSDEPIPAHKQPTKAD